MRRNLTCWECKQPVLVKNVGQERRRYPGFDEVLCRACQRKRVDAMVARVRKELGLAPRS